MPVTEHATPPATSVRRTGGRPIGRSRALLTLAALVLSSAAALAMSVARGYRTEERMAEYQGLRWNLFLAWIPVLLAFVTYRFHVRGNRPNVLLVGCVLAWFFFFPNAPYIVTDFIHLQHRPPVPLWFDLWMIASFAWTGLCLGYLSLYLMQEIARERFGVWPSWGFVVAMLFLGSIGIYIGRFLRWNSWDVLRHPKGLLRGGWKLVEDTDGQLGVAVYVSVAFLFLFSTYCATFALTHLHERETG